MRAATVGDLTRIEIKSKVSYDYFITPVASQVN